MADKSKSTGSLRHLVQARRQIVDLHLTNCPGINLFFEADSRLPHKDSFKLLLTCFSSQTERPVSVVKTFLLADPLAISCGASRKSPRRLSGGLRINITTTYIPRLAILPKINARAERPVTHTLDLHSSWRQSTRLPPLLRSVRGTICLRRTFFGPPHSYTTNSVRRWTYLELNVDNVMNKLQEGLDMKTYM